MDRRGFLRMMIAAGAAHVVEQAIPLNRVFSFPKDIRVASYGDYVSLASLATVYFDSKALERLAESMSFRAAATIRTLSASDGRVIKWRG